MYNNKIKNYTIVGIDGDLIVLDLLYKNNNNLEMSDGNIFFPKKQATFDRMSKGNQIEII